MSLAAKKLKICGACGSEFRPFLSTQKVCRTVECALALVREKAREKEKKEFNQETRRRKAALLDNDVSHWTKKAQKEFNRFIRLRDDKDPCISCSKFLPASKHVNGWDCGHFRTVGAMPQLRFEELNAHKQCKSCNSGSYHHAHKSETVAAQYKRSIAAKIGDLKMTWLLGPHPLKHYRVEDLKEIYRTYKLKADHLEKSGDFVGRGGSG